MQANWDSSSWIGSNKILFLLATVWPGIYMFLFMGVIFSMMAFLPFAEKDGRSCGYIDSLQLDRKIKNGEIKELNIRRDEIRAVDRIGNCEFEVTTSNEDTRREILRDAREMVDGHPRVEKIEEETSRPAGAPLSTFIPLGFAGLMIAHMATMLLIMALMPAYIILAVKNVRLDQTMQIIWVVLFCTVGMFANPVYWYLYVWRKPKAQPDGGSDAQPPVDNTTASI